MKNVEITLLVQSFFLKIRFVFLTQIKNSQFVILMALIWRNFQSLQEPQAERKVPQHTIKLTWFTQLHWERFSHLLTRMVDLSLYTIFLLEKFFMNWLYPILRPCTGTITSHMQLLLLRIVRLKSFILTFRVNNCEQEFRNRKFLERKCKDKNWMLWWRKQCIYLFNFNSH